MFEQVFNNLYEKNKGRRAKFVDGDYYAPCFFDEPELKVLYCGECNEKKETWFYIPTQPYHGNEVAPKEHRNLQFLVTVPCKCERDKAVKAKKEASFNRLVSDRRLKCWGYPNEYGQLQRNKAMEQITFENHELNKHTKKAKGYFDSFVERQEEGKGVIFIGKAGSGKTVAAMCLANALLSRGIEVVFKQQFQIIRLSQYEDKRDIEELESCKVLFIDDFNPEFLTEYGATLLFNIFELRIKRGLVTCFTSNIKREALEKPRTNSDKLIFDRILANCYIVEDSSKNYRNEVNEL